MATNYAKATYTEVYDFGTKSGNVTVVGIHTPDNTRPRLMLSGFFSQFRKFRYVGAKVTIVPAAQLPADPLQISYEAGEIAIDPRDMLNPVMFHGCYGESLNQALDVAYTSTKSYSTAFSKLTDSLCVIDNPFAENASDSGWFSDSEDAYYAALSDPSWRKYGIQQGMRLPFLSPRVWKTATNMPLLRGEVLSGAGQVGDMNSYDIMLKISEQLQAAGQPGLDANEIHDGMFFNPAMEYVTGQHETSQLTSSPTFLSSGTTKLGWLPTYTMRQVDGEFPSQISYMPVQLPKVFMGVLILPPSYKQELYFRMSIQHYFEFRDFSTSMPVPNSAYDEGLPDQSTMSDMSIETNGSIALTTVGVS